MVLLREVLQSSRQISRMPSIKSRAHHSVSSCTNSLNKENHLDFGNRVTQLHKKPPTRMLPEDHLDLKPHKPVPKNLPSLSIDTSLRTQALSTPQKIKMEENQMLARNYATDILDCLIETDKAIRLSNVLFTHNIPKDLRCRMIDWMIEVIGAFKFTEESFFTAVRLMDTFLMKTKKSHEPQEVHLTGVTCMYIATKFEEVYPLKLKTVFQKIGHRKLPGQTILKKESEILETLEFGITGVNHFELINQLLYMSKLQERLDRKKMSYLLKVCVYLSKMVTFDIDILTQYDYSTLACANMYVAFKIIEQVQSEFSPEVEIKECLKHVEIKESSMMEAASKILSLAKNFDKVHYNLHNLKKFNGFAFEEGAESGDKPVTSR